MYLTYNQIPSALGRHRIFWLLWTASVLLFHAPLARLLQLASEEDSYSYLVLIPFVTAALLYLERHAVFAGVSYGYRAAAVALLGAAAILIVAGQTALPGTYNSLAAAMFALVLVWTGLFLLCYGGRAYRAGLFPFVFLLLLVPLPAAWLDAATVALQSGSAAISAVLFQLAGVPFLRHGFSFRLPGVEIEIARQCSGIRSSIILLLTTIPGGYLLFRSVGRRWCFSLVTIPLVLFKNAVRIVTISWLGLHVDPAFFTGNLHHYSGLPFSFLAVAILAPWLWFLRRSEVAQRARLSSHSNSLIPAHSSMDTGALNP